VAAHKFPDRHLHLADLAQVDVQLPNLSFSAGLCFHVLMHLPESEVRTVLRQAASLMASGGVLIVDIPAKVRRRFGRRGDAGWHGNTSATLAEFSSWVEPEWRISRWRGLLLFPIHRFPSWTRPWLMKLDRMLCHTPLGRFASYYVIELKR
jgi:SAM-dependent methyltransferase